MDDQRIDCDLCRKTAAANFMRCNDGGYSYVFKQPTRRWKDARSKQSGTTAKAERSNHYKELSGPTDSANGRTRST